MFQTCDWTDMDTQTGEALGYLHPDTHSLAKRELGIGFLGPTHVAHITCDWKKET